MFDCSIQQITSFSVGEVHIVHIFSELSNHSGDQARSHWLSHFRAIHGHWDDPIHGIFPLIFPWRWYQLRRIMLTNQNGINLVNIYHGIIILLYIYIYLVNHYIQTALLTKSLDSPLFFVSELSPLTRPNVPVVPPVGRRWSLPAPRVPLAPPASCSFASAAYLPGSKAESS